MVSTVVPFALN